MSEQQPEDYVKKNGAGKYPNAPTKCPYRDCGTNLVMKKNGFYSRFLITKAFYGKVRVRRYKCPKCKRTVSMLPSFCLAGFTYGVEYIMGLLRMAVELGSIKRAVMVWSSNIGSISRRHVNQYMARIRNNRKMIQYGMNQISPENINIGSSPGDTEWTKSFLFGIRPTLPTEFNANFHIVTGKSFMSTQNRIA